MTISTSCLGFPRIGAGRELKQALEAYWAGDLDPQELEQAAADLRLRHWTLMKQAGNRPDSEQRLLPLRPHARHGSFRRRRARSVCVDSRFARPLLRHGAGRPGPKRGLDIPALEMTKWFDTNYHYLVPEIAPDQDFALNADKVLREVREARTAGIAVRPVLTGPVTFLRLAKLPEGVTGGSPLDALSKLLPVYAKLLQALKAEGVDSVQLDEPYLVLDLDDRTREAFVEAFKALSETPNRPRVQLTTYFGALGENLDLATSSGFEALHVDLVRTPEQLGVVLDALPSTMSLSLGVVDGRNIWRTDLDAALSLVRMAAERLGDARIAVAPSCSLLHVPVDLDGETQLDAEVKSWMAFAMQKLHELKSLADAANNSASDQLSEETRTALASRASAERTNNPAVRNAVAKLGASDLSRANPYTIRAAAQERRLHLPLFPTTTIGSFPQTRDVRRMRASWRGGRITEDAYNEFLRTKTEECIRLQERIGLDVIVHGEFERNDMVEYFGEQLEGFAFTENGWVQSYGSRCVKPPILFGDVARRAPMTVDWAKFAQALTDRPMKGMITGPITMLEWSFVRDDQSRRDTCLQIALALRAEVQDLEEAGISIIQVDEPALREGLPLRRAAWDEYLRWAVDAFRLTTAGVQDETQIHTHMCYAEFEDILPAISEMDADVISIETSRSRMELLDDFRGFDYKAQIGPGVYDIHSPRVPSPEEMLELMERAMNVLPRDSLWVNPDCGLKTRGWDEVEGALVNMVEAVTTLRARSSVATV